jgi:histidinol-phosphate aminotransferase
VSSLDQIESRDDIVPFKLDWNEATQAPSAKVRDALLRMVADATHFQWYPDLGARKLTQDLAEYTGVPAESIIVTNGSDDALCLLARSFLRAGVEVLVPVPTYTHFLVYAKGQNARVVEIAEPDPFRTNIRHLERSIGGRTRMVYLVSPNNPTGTMWDEEEISYLCHRHPHVLFVVDEAYYEFSGKSVIGLTQTYTNLAVTRTFSKAFGLAAFRVGYLAAAPGVCEQLWRLHNPKSVNMMGQVAASAALEDLDHLNNYVDEVRAAVVDFVDEMRGLGFEARETPANYAVLRVPDPAALLSELEERNVYIRNRSHMPRMQGMVRITVGTREQMKEVTARMKQVFEKLGWLTA